MIAKRFFYIASMALLSLVAGGCATARRQQLIDQAKFDGVYRAGHAVQDAMSFNSAQDIRALIGAFTTEASMAKENATTEEEKQLAEAYGVIAARYRFYWELGEAQRGVGQAPSNGSKYARLADKLGRINQVMLGKSDANPQAIAVESD